MLADVENGNNIRMVQSGGGLRLQLETVQTLGVARPVLREHLDCHVPFQRGSRARYTSPIPPAPSGAMISYESRREPVASCIGGLNYTRRCDASLDRPKSVSVFLLASVVLSPIPQLSRHKSVCALSGTHSARPAAVECCQTGSLSEPAATLTPPVKLAILCPP